MFVVISSFCILVCLPNLLHRCRQVHFATKLLNYPTKLSKSSRFSIKKLTLISFYNHFDNICINSEAKVCNLIIICNFAEK